MSKPTTREIYSQVEIISLMNQGARLLINKHYATFELWTADDKRLPVERDAAELLEWRGFIGRSGEVSESENEYELTPAGRTAAEQE